MHNSPVPVQAADHGVLVGGIGVWLVALLLLVFVVLSVVALGLLLWWLVRNFPGATAETGRRPHDHRAPTPTAGVPCPVCGHELPAGAPHGLCPRCLLVAGAEASSPAPDLAAATTAYRPGPAPQPPQELAGAFPQLEIFELLGRGGMGAVYKARQPHLDRLVALKVLPPETANDPAFGERFAREARALAKLNHPNIVAVHDFGQSGGFFYLVMEYVDGVNLRQAMRAGRLTPEEALRIVPQLCDALQFAHEEGVVHRDIKPENILLDRRGRVKVADFGLAKILGQSTGNASLTGTQQVMGTLHYMAPEQLAGARAVDHRADIYSLGVTFYEMLTGELPLGRFPPPSRKAALDARLDDVVLRTLEHAPADRYQHASDLKTDLDAIAHTPSTRPRPASDAPALRHTYAAWVGFPTLLLFGIFALAMALVFIDGGADKDTLVAAGRVTALLVGAFGALNLLWFVLGRHRSAPSTPDQQAAGHPWGGSGRRPHRPSGPRRAAESTPGPAGTDGPESGTRPIAGGPQESAAHASGWFVARLWRSPGRRAALAVAWTVACVVGYVVFWSAADPRADSESALYRGYIDSWYWPYHGVAESWVILEPVTPAYRRLVIKELIEVRRPGCRQDGLTPAGIRLADRTRHEFVLHLDGNDGQGRDLFVDALNRLAWHHRNRFNSNDVRGDLLDAPMVLSWMFDDMDKRKGERPPPDGLREQARFCIELIRQAATGRTPPRTFIGRETVGRLDAFAWDLRNRWMNELKPFPFRDWTGGEKTTLDPVVSIASVGVPLMLAVWAAALWFLYRRAARPSGPAADDERTIPT